MSRMGRWIQRQGDHTGYFQGLSAGEFPEAVLDLLKEASLFYHVPAAYLFPAPDMMKPDSLNFFQVDHNWVLAMLDGICSVGRNASIDYSHDTEMIAAIYRQALKENEQVRLKLQGKETSETDGEEVGIISGFLLNSVLVENFRGLEFRAYDQPEGGELLTALRIETLGRQLLLGIFKGEIKRLEIAQAPEGLHFGFLTEDGVIKKTVRDIEEGKLTGEQAELSWKSKEDRVIDVKASAESIRKTAGLDRMTSAEFALEMIQNAQTGVFTMDDPSIKRGSSVENFR